MVKVRRIGLVVILMVMVKVDFSDAITLVNHYGLDAKLADGVVGDHILEGALPVVVAGEVYLEVDIVTGEIRLVGGDVGITGYSIKSDSDSLGADSDNRSDLFQLYLANREGEVSAISFNASGDVLIDGVVVLDVSLSDLSARDVAFSYGIRGESARTGVVSYVPEPSVSLLLLAGLGMIGFKRK